MTTITKVERAAMRIAMWSGPRNLSTAMMYAFATQPDFSVWDEPFYGAYLAQSGAKHPMGDDVLAACENDPHEVARACLGPIANDAPHAYQKHMTHHMLPSFPMDWIAKVANVFLIRHPARVVASYSVKRENPQANDLGYQAQLDILNKVEALGQRPLVLDSADIRRNPSGLLKILLEELGFEDAGARSRQMIHWEEGGIPEDGPWAPHWYGAVHRSTGFSGEEGTLPNLTGDAKQLADGLMPIYEALAAKKLTL